MASRLVSLALVTALCGGCVSSTHSADQWPYLYSKPGATIQQLNEDGGACQSGATMGMFFLGAATAGLMTPLVSYGTDSTVHMDKHAACMKAKGYTVLSEQAAQPK